ncbi:aldo/keto reductase [Amycolatopsis magusensis]|uniref:Diketogulonate reductase-like aldo/keto reductase n=1 Tax=Amycolatopsis magusensis TaxID=882444 RepID=A0ABS4PPE1_9PSEU|nr:aldo/keto reductase [Amycolatopsis magusensis]MBP2181306.1 diketogulonate reductase-like aldo/keto reductase [Amycolatopsis magusensis]MDI5977006.1 aldo/keto reductase [Amycolatopsis magusensis]
MTGIPTVTLNNGVVMPQLGYGVFQVPDAETTAAVTSALEAGYRSIDTATVYGNERGVGQALADSGLAREELFITTKVWNSDQGYDKALRAFDNSAELLGLDYLDLYLIHWPTPERGLYAETWRALEKLHADGRIRAIGVSNFQPSHLDELARTSSVVPAVNQIEVHPYLQQAEVREYDEKHGIVTEAWSPLAKGGDLLADPVVRELAEKHGRTPAQIVLRWHVQLGNVVIPKSVTPSRIRENAALFDFELADEDVAALSSLDRGERTGPDPDTFNVA